MIIILFTSVFIFSIYSHSTINEDPKVLNEMLDDRVVVFRRSAPLDRTKRSYSNNNLNGFKPNCITITSWKWIHNIISRQDRGDPLSSVLLGSVVNNGTVYKQYVKEINCRGYNGTSKCLGIDNHSWLSYCDQLFTYVNVSTYKDVGNYGTASFKVHSGCRCMVKEKIANNEANMIRNKQ
nr:CPPV287 beta-NGF-like family protein [Cooks petrelpox virus]